MGIKHELFDSLLSHRTTIIDDRDILCSRYWIQGHILLGRITVDRVLGQNTLQTIHESEKQNIAANCKHQCDEACMQIDHPP